MSVDGCVLPIWRFPYRACRWVCVTHLTVPLPCLSMGVCYPSDGSLTVPVDGCVLPIWRFPYRACLWVCVAHLTVPLPCLSIWVCVTHLTVPLPCLSMGVCYPSDGSLSAPVDGCVLPIWRFPYRACRWVCAGAPVRWRPSPPCGTSAGTVVCWGAGSRARCPVAHGTSPAGTQRRRRSDARRRRKSAPAKDCPSRAASRCPAPRGSSAGTRPGRSWRPHGRRAAGPFERSRTGRALPDTVIVRVRVRVFVCLLGF